MKQFLFILFSFLSLVSEAQKSIPKPNPMRLVNDNANLLAKYDADILEKKLVALDDSTSNQIVVLTIPSLNGEIIEEVAVKTFREWGIGSKKNNGVLLIIAIEDRKVRIEVGYGLEGAIPDVVANDIINNYLKPAFKEKNYVAGINNAVDNLSKAAVGEYKIKKNKKGNNGSNGGSILMFIVILIIVIIIIGRGGGGRGRNGRLNAADFILPMIFSNLGRGGGGGGWSDSGGGGFGGFGGGSSGGGGASGDW